MGKALPFPLLLGLLSVLVGCSTDDPPAHTLEFSGVALTDEAANLLQAIRELRAQDPEFEMYLMLGAWIDARHEWH